MKSEWQDVLDRFHYGIYLVTVSSPEGRNGMIASWVTQCSHEPPLVAMAIRKNRLAHEQILKSRKFCLNVLSRDFISKIKQFKISYWKKKFDAFNYELSPNGHPVLDDCIGYLDFALVSTVDTGDHSLFIGRIEAGAIQEAGKSAALSTADYNGVYQGYYIDFEAKETKNKNSFPLKNLHAHQIEHMKKCLSHRGICFVLLWFSSLNRCFFIDSHYIVHYWEQQATKKKSLSLATIEEIGIEIIPGVAPRIPYLQAVDQFIELKEQTSCQTIHEHSVMNHQKRKQ